MAMDETGHLDPDSLTKGRIEKLQTVQRWIPKEYHNERVATRPKRHETKLSLS